MIGNKAWRLALLRRLLGRSPLRVAREEAIATAVAAWLARPGSRSQEPNPSADEDLDGWTVWIFQKMAPIPYVKIDGRTGKVASVGIPPR